MLEEKKLCFHGFKPGIRPTHAHHKSLMKNFSCNITPSYTFFTEVHIYQLVGWKRKVFVSWHFTQGFRTCRVDLQAYYMTLSTQGTVNTALVSTSLVSIRDPGGNQLPIRACLNSACHASFITAGETIFLILPTRSCQSLIQWFGSGSAQSQHICGWLPTTLDDSIEVILQISRRLKNAITYRKNNISRMKHVQNLDPADLHFDTPGKIDIFRVDAFLEDLQ